jgi:biotin transport system substrate-specific component
MVTAPRTSPLRSTLTSVALVAGGSLLMILSAQVTVPIGPVPITLQTLAIPVIVALLGRELGTLAVLAYLAEGAVGWPVFSEHLGGIGAFFRPSGGFLIGFPIAAFVIGTFYHDGFGRNYLKRFVSVFVGTATVFVSGVLWLALSYTHDLVAAITVGVLPFIVGDIAKCVIAAAVPPRSPDNSQNFDARSV